MKVNYREHEFGPAEPRMRVWTDEMSGYGQFEVISHEDFLMLKALSERYPSLLTLVEADD